MNYKNKTNKLCAPPRSLRLCVHWMASNMDLVLTCDRSIGMTLRNQYRFSIRWVVQQSSSTGRLPDFTLAAPSRGQGCMPTVTGRVKRSGKLRSLAAHSRLSKDVLRRLMMVVLQQPSELLLANDVVKANMRRWSGMWQRDRNRDIAEPLVGTILVIIV